MCNKCGSKYGHQPWCPDLGEPENERVSRTPESAGSVPTWIKIKLRKAIHYIHNEDDYEKGMDVIAELAGIEVNETGAVQTTVSKLLEQNS